jgi:glycosyltransferase involved in cell wall biosynthesis
VIAISRLLESHFEGRGRNVIRIPTILDVLSMPCVDRAPADRLVLLYAGMPGRKDLLKEIFVALVALDPDERSRIEFRLLGPTKAELVALLGGSASLLDQLADTVKPLGRVPRNQVLAALQEAHFTVLLRPDKRYAKAGFPSKVPESLAAGVPVLLSLTGDLAEYLGDERAALSVRGCSAGEMAKTIRRALQLSQGQLKELRRHARTKAEEFFDYRGYVDSFGHFLEHLRSEAGNTLNV